MKAAKKQYSDAQIRKIETDAFNHGYVLACANSFNLHGNDVISADTLAQLGISWGAIKRMDLGSYDEEPLRKLYKQIERRKP